MISLTSRVMLTSRMARQDLSSGITFSTEAREGPVEAGAAAARGAAGLYAETGRAADDRANRIPSREINVKSEVMEAAVVGIFMKVR